ncbi:MAG: hypothetical protein AAF653_12845 [Chloroflexota bacterium]
MPDTPETMDFLLMALGATAVLMAGYVGSMFVRYRNLQKDAELIQQLAEDDE